MITTNNGGKSFCGEAKTVLASSGLTLPSMAGEDTCRVIVDVRQEHPEAVVTVNALNAITFDRKNGVVVFSFSDGTNLPLPINANEAMKGLSATSLIVFGNPADNADPFETLLVAPEEPMPQ